MSIINDALKKTQDKMTNPSDKESKEENNVKNEPGETTDNVDIGSLYEKHRQKKVEGNEKKASASIQPGSPQKPPQSTVKNIFLAILCVAIVIASLVFIVNYLSNDAPRDTKRAFNKFKRNFSLPGSLKPAPSASIRHRPRPMIQHPTPPAPSSHASPSSEPLILSGTVQQGERYVALINDKIYETGDSIGSRKITSINLDKVEIQDGENIVTLRVGEKK